MPEAITVEVPIDESVGAGAHVRVLAGPTAAGLDTDLPISGRIPCWPASAKDELWLEDRWLEGRWLNGVGYGGWLDGLWLEHEWLGFEDVVRWSGGHAYGPAGETGTLQIACQVYDHDGRVSATSPPETTITLNTSPMPGRDLVATSKTGDQVTFTFTPSRSIVRNDGVAK